LSGRARVLTWVRAERAELDPVLHQLLLGWLETERPFDSIESAARE
jgi:hypothetical protein